MFRCHRGKNLNILLKYTVDIVYLVHIVPSLPSFGEQSNTDSLILVYIMKYVCLYLCVYESFKN